MIYVVLGMHKSGTTLVSQILHHSGISMGGGIDAGISYDGGNKYEDDDSLALNLEFLGAPDHEVLYLPPPDPLVATEDQRRRMREFIAARQARAENWGFKDPRTTLVYPLWKAELPEHRIIAIYRSPSEIWPRFMAAGWRDLPQDPKRVWHFLLRWCEHNERIVRYLRETDRDFLLLSYREFMSGDREFARLREFVGSDLDDRRRKSLYRNAPQSYILLEGAKRLVRWRTSHDPDAITRELEALRERG